MQAQAIADPDHHHSYYPSKENYYSVWNLPVPLGTPMWGSGKGGPQTPDVAQKNPTAPPRGNDQNSSPPGSPSGNPLATAGPGHKKPLGQVSRGTDFRSGDANTESGRVAKRGGDDSPDAAGSAITGSGVGAATGTNKIVANSAAVNANGENPNSNDPNSSSGFFADSAKSESGSSSFGAGSSRDSNSSETKSASILKNTKTGDDGLNDPDFFKKSLGDNIDNRIGRTKPRTSDGTFAGPSGGATLNRTPASKGNSTNPKPRTQVGFERGV
jgi:hypothetical protein